jgi:hypothetical protein
MRVVLDVRVARTRDEKTTTTIEKFGFLETPREGAWTIHYCRTQYRDRKCVHTIHIEYELLTPRFGL